jgi:hypothetical protein
MKRCGCDKAKKRNWLITQMESHEKREKADVALQITYTIIQNEDKAM